MKILLAAGAEPVRFAIEDILGGGKNGCTELRSCSLDDSAERVVQYRPDAVLVDVSGPAAAAWRAIQEVQETHPVRVVAVGPSHDAKFILQTLNQGVYRYVDTDQADEELPQALRRLRAEPPLAVRQGRVIAVVGVSGGCGASTLAVNIAASLGRHGERRPALVDLDLEGGDLAALLNVQPTRSLADFCENVARMDAAMFEKCQVAHKSGLVLVASPQRYQDIPKVTSRGVRKVLAMAQAKFDYVVADVPRTYRPEHAQALFRADAVVLVLRPEFTSVRHASRTLAYLDDLGVPRERVRLVVNRVDRTALRTKDIESSLKLRVMMEIPENARHVSRAVNRGIPLVQDRPRSPVSYRLFELAGSVNGKM